MLITISSLFSSVFITWKLRLQLKLRGASGKCLKPVAVPSPGPTEYMQSKKDIKKLHGTVPFKFYVKIVYWRRGIMKTAQKEIGLITIQQCHSCFLIHQPTISLICYQKFTYSRPKICKIYIFLHHWFFFTKSDDVNWTFILPFAAGNVNLDNMINFWILNYRLTT